MTRPLPSAKQSVDLAPVPRVSRIRRDPPPIVKHSEVADPRDRESRMVTIGVVTFALALFAILVGFASFSGWSPSQYTVEMNLSD